MEKAPEKAAVAISTKPAGEQTSGRRRHIKEDKQIEHRFLTRLNKLIKQQLKRGVYRPRKKEKKETGAHQVAERRATGRTEEEGGKKETNAQRTTG